MNKNTIIGFILIGVIMFGFSWYQSKQYKEQQIEQQKARIEQMMEQSAADYAETVADEKKEQKEQVPAHVVKTLPFGLEAAVPARKGVTFHTISNGRLELEFSTLGAQPSTVTVKDHKNYGGAPLRIFHPDSTGRVGSRMNYSLLIRTGQYLNTADYVFDYIAEESDSSKIVMRLPFEDGSYIQQVYSLEEDSYMVDNEMTFVGMDEILTHTASSFKLDWDVVIPRMEKGYKNELRYSKLCYQPSGEDGIEEMAQGRDEEEQITTKTKWFAFQQQFFSAIMTADDDFNSAAFKASFYDENDPSHNLMKCSASMGINMAQDGSYKNQFYFGPNDFKTMKQYGRNYEKMIPIGGWLVGWISRWVIIPVFDFLGGFIHNYGIVILLLTLLIKLVVSPLTIKSYMSSAKMSALKPEIEKLNEKYPKQEDAMKKQTAMMDLYRRAGISPMGGCLPMLLQFPILWAMFRFFPASIELRQQGFLWADDLSAYDSILDFGFNIPLYGDHVSLFALLMALSMFLYSKMTSSQMSDDPSMAGMKFMSVWMMPIMMLFICNNLSSGLSYYYLLSNLITMLQTWVIRRFFVNEKKIQAQLAAAPAKKKAKSKWQLRLEEAQRMQEQMMKEKNKKNHR